MAIWNYSYAYINGYYLLLYSSTHRDKTINWRILFRYRVYGMGIIWEDNYRFSNSISVTRIYMRLYSFYCLKLIENNKSSYGLMWCHLIRWYKLTSKLLVFWNCWILILCTPCVFLNNKNMEQISCNSRYLHFDWSDINTHICNPKRN